MGGWCRGLSPDAPHGQVPVMIARHFARILSGCSRGQRLQHGASLSGQKKIHTARRYERSVQFGAYMWRNGLNRVKMGSKRAQLSRLSTPNGPRSPLEKHIFDSFLASFCSQSGPFSRLFGTLEAPKWLKSRSKWAQFTCLCTPNGPQSHLEKPVFSTTGVKHVLPTRPHCLLAPSVSSSRPHHLSHPPVSMMHLDNSPPPPLQGACWLVLCGCSVVRVRLPHAMLGD